MSTYSHQLASESILFYYLKIIRATLNPQLTIKVLGGSGLITPLGPARHQVGGRPLEQRPAKREPITTLRSILQMAREGADPHVRTVQGH